MKHLGVLLRCLEIWYLYKSVCIKGKHKIRDNWKHDPYIVISQPNDDIPVYEVPRDNPRAKKIRLLHCTLLLPFIGLPRLDEEDFGEDPDRVVVVWNNRQDQTTSQCQCMIFPTMCYVRPAKSQISLRILAV